MKNNNELDLNEINNGYKYLYRDSDTGKNIITDYNNNKFQSDIFGRRLQKFLPNISGMLSGKNRLLTLKMINSKSANEMWGNNATNLNQEKKSFYKKYIPGINKIEGYSCAPKPISTPFYNADNSLLPDKFKNKLNLNLRKYYSTENHKILKNNNFQISYMNKDLGEDQLKKRDEEKIMNLINKNIEQIKAENKMKLNSIEKNSKYISLTRFKKRILDNNKNSLYLKFDEAPLEIKGKNNIIKNVIKNRINEIKKKQNIFERKKGEYLQKYIRSNRSNILFDIPKKKYHIKGLIIGPDKLNDLCQSKDFSIGRTIKMDFGNNNEKNNTKENKDINNNNENKTEIEQNLKINNILPKIVKRLRSGNNSYLYQDTETAETNINNSDIALARNKSYDELSIISKENEKKDRKEKKINPKHNFRSLKSVKTNAEIENELLKGIQLRPPKEINKIKKYNGKVTLKTEGQLYKENLELLKLTNKRHFEMLQHKDEYDLFLLKKKLENKRKISLFLNPK